MIYKITYDLKQSQNIFLKTISDLGDFIFLNKTFYLNSKLPKRDIITNLKNILQNEEEQFLTKELDINSNSFPEQITDWVNKIKFEKEKEHAIKVHKSNVEIVMNVLENLQEELEKQIKDGGEDSGGESK
jgi:hypothetical protein